MKFKVVIFDLDGTIWNHGDISALSPPFKKVSDDIIEDSRGNLVKLYPYVKETLSELKSMDLVLAIASWNKEEIALSTLKAFNLINFFDYYCIEYHSRKEKMIKKLLNRINRERTRVYPIQIIYIDDRDIHLSNIIREVGEIYFIHM